MASLALLPAQPLPAAGADEAGSDSDTIVRMEYQAAARRFPILAAAAAAAIVALGAVASTRGLSFRASGSIGKHEALRWASARALDEVTCHCNGPRSYVCDNGTTVSCSATSHEVCGPADPWTYTDNVADVCVPATCACDGLGGYACNDNFTDTCDAATHKATCDCSADTNNSYVCGGNGVPSSCPLHQVCGATAPWDYTDNLTGICVPAECWCNLGDGGRAAPTNYTCSDGYVGACSCSQVCLSGNPWRYSDSTPAACLDASAGWAEFGTCQSGQNRLTGTPASVAEKAKTATMLKICTKSATGAYDACSADADCVISAPSSFPAEMLKIGRAVDHVYGTACDKGCGRNVWYDIGANSRAQTVWNTGTPDAVDYAPGMTLDGSHPFMGSSGNTAGPVVNFADSATCGWSSSGSESLVFFLNGQPTTA